jgi:hypothetical protein
MPLGVLLEDCFAPACAVNVCLRDLSLFGKSMHQDGDITAMKEIQDAVVHAALACSKLVETIA